VLHCLYFSGGQLGLWIGISFVTLTEVLQYLFLRFKAVLRRSPKSPKRDLGDHDSYVGNGTIQSKKAWIKQTDQN